jgi:hypothetical protein
VRATADAQGRVERLIERPVAAGTGHVTTMLQRLDAPGGFLGDFAAAPGLVTGSPTGFNRVVVTGPNGAVLGRTSRFAVAGQMAADTAMSSVNKDSLQFRAQKRAVTKTVRFDSFGTAAATPRVKKQGTNPGAFRVQHTCGAVAPGRACAIRVTYRPRPNVDKAVLVIDDNSLTRPYRVKLRG